MNVNSKNTKMKNTIQIVLIMLVSIFLNTQIFAQSKDWNTEKTKDGSVTVQSRISKRTDEEGNTVTLIEYIATTIDSVSMKNCVSVIKDVAKHKEFQSELVESKKVETISDNEWVVYYYADYPWPWPDSDCVAIMKFSEDTTQRKATFTLTGAPAKFEERDVKRMTYFNVTYSFQDLGNDIVKMTLTSKTSPVVYVPTWMLKQFFFPDGPAAYLWGISNLAKNN